MRDRRMHDGAACKRRKTVIDRWVFGDIFVHFCNEIIPIFMYKYVKGFWVERF
jgi:hypothetical protein